MPDSRYSHDQHVQTADASHDGSASFSPPSLGQYAVEPALVADSDLDHSIGSTHFRGAVGAVVLGNVDKLIQETRKRDLLEGNRLDVETVVNRPYVLDPNWQRVSERISSAWQRGTSVVIVVSERGFGSTTFSQQLLARQQSGKTLFELEADWDKPAVGKLPVERSHAYQLDLKDPTHDEPTGLFLDRLVQYAKDLKSCDSYLVITVTTDLWAGFRHWTGEGVTVVDLSTPPPAGEVVEAHLKSDSYSDLVPYAQDLKAIEHIQGRDAVAAVRAARTIIEQARHHRRSQLPHSVGSAPHADGAALDNDLREKINTALSDWREELDKLFGAAVEDGGALSLEDRCLLLALAVRKTAPVAHLDEAGRALCKLLVDSPEAQTELTASPAAIFGGRGLRSRLRGLSAAVDPRDSAVLTKRGYGDAVVSYVWDNYAVTRRPILEWLVDGAGAPGDVATVTETLVTLLTRHSGQDHLNRLRDAAVLAGQPDVLAAVMEAIVHDEHIGRVAWSALYSWATQDNALLHGVVLSACSSVLRKDQSTRTSRQLALVRLRRIVTKATDPKLAQAALDLLSELVRTPDGQAQLINEVTRWQQSRPSMGELAFLALMELDDSDGPMLLIRTPEGVDVRSGLRRLLTYRDSWPQIVPAVIRWFQTCDDVDQYTSLRDLVIELLRSGRSFDAGMSLMAQLDSMPAPDDSEASIGRQVWEGFVDPHLRSAFPLPSDGE